ncbi:hypothetical protein B0H17DRAFT_1126956 [Mycena rosella]|uniref:Uncharacterized protein n=1 Tax=Mycena rosella TaxID=1033263 RepID=A0AAD7GRW2_MYCRO|nr:hypothetical protein B0H17DRAFT_1126956 [Mycena rosella]
MSTRAPAASIGRRQAEDFSGEHTYIACEKTADEKFDAPPKTADGAPHTKSPHVYLKVRTIQFEQRRTNSPPRPRARGAALRLDRPRPSPPKLKDTHISTLPAVAPPWTISPRAPDATPARILASEDIAESSRSNSTPRFKILASATRTRTLTLDYIPFGQVPQRTPSHPSIKSPPRPSHHPRNMSMNMDVFGTPNRTNLDEFRCAP